MNLNNFRKIYEGSSKSSIITYIILRLLIIFCFIRQMFLGNYTDALLCIISTFLFTIPMIIEDKFKLQLPSGLEISIFVFIFSAEILGEIENFYGNIYVWDTILHTINGFLAASIGFNLVDLLNNKIDSFNLSPLFVSLIAFCFSMTIGIVWEFFEFTSDQLLLSDMQKDRIVSTISSVKLNEKNLNKSVIIKDIGYTTIYDKNGNVLITIDGGYLDVGIIDTMKDLFVNLVGAIVFSTFGYLYISNRDKYKFVGKFHIKKET